MKVKWFMLVCLLVAVLVVVGCAPTKVPTPKAEVPAGYRSIRMLGGSLGSRTATAVMTLAAVFNRYYPEVEWSSASGATVTNTIYLTKGTIKLGTNNAGAYTEAYGFDKIPESRLRSVCSVGPLTHFVMLIPQDKPWKDISEVPKGLALCPGTPGSMSVPMTEQWLALAGLSKEHFRWIPMTKTELADAWRAGKVDITVYTVAGVDPTLLDMNSARKFKPMGLSPEQAAKAKAEQTFERVGAEAPIMGHITELAPEMFKADVVATTWLAVLSSRDDFPEEIAYRMTKVIDERHSELVSIFAPMKYATPQYLIPWARPPLDMHPGVAKYYKEKGYLK